MLRGALSKSFLTISEDVVKRSKSLPIVGEPPLKVYIQNRDHDGYTIVFARSMDEAMIEANKKDPMFDPKYGMVENEIVEKGVIIF